MFHRAVILLVLLTAAPAWAPALAQAPPGALAQAPGVKLRAADVLNIIVADQPDLTKKYPIEPDGTITLPLVGRLEAAGKTVEQVASELQKRLAEFLKDPQVRIAVERPRRVFIFGGVTSPGMYQLTEHMTLVELLARAGYTGASEVVIVRNRGTSPPAFPDGDSAAEVLRVNLREFEKELESGELSRNVVLEDGDTVFVPRFDPNRVYVSGEVRTPGAYSIPEGTTVLQALTLAGGPTEDAALGRVRIVRLDGGKQVNIRVKLEDVVRPGDTLIVPRRRF